MKVGILFPSPLKSNGRLARWVRSSRLQLKHTERSEVKLGQSLCATFKRIFLWHPWSTFPLTWMSLCGSVLQKHPSWSQSLIFLHACNMSLRVFDWCSLFSSGPDQALGPDHHQQEREEAAARGAGELLHLVHGALGRRSRRAGRGHQGRHLAQPAAVLPGGWYWLVPLQLLCLHLSLLKEKEKNVLLCNRTTECNLKFNIDVE